MRSITLLCVVCFLAASASATDEVEDFESAEVGPRDFGGFETVDINSEFIQDIKAYAEAQYLAGGSKSEGLGELVSAQTQVVAGTNVELTFKRPDGSKCQITVWDQSWTKTRQVTESTCSHVAITADFYDES